jgi:molybdenum cofactor biosynthesis protein B
VSHHPHRESGPERPAIALLTVSDTRTEQDDRSGATARELIESHGGRVVAYRILSDDPPSVRAQVRSWVSNDEIDAVIVNGGTGISPRDRTYEALDGILDQRLDGFGELFRSLSFLEIGAAAMLSRAIGGVCSGKPVFSLPGSPGAVRLALERLILPELRHLIGELNRNDPGS